MVWDRANGSGTRKRDLREGTEGRNKEKGFETGKWGFAKGKGDLRQGNGDLRKGKGIWETLKGSETGKRDLGDVKGI